MMFDIHRRDKMFYLREFHKARNVSGVFSGLINITLFFLFVIASIRPVSAELQRESPLSNFVVYLPIVFKPDLTPIPFNKYAPATNTMGLSLNPILSWTKSPNSTRYEYCLDTSNDGVCSDWISTGTNNYAGLWGLQHGTTYYWQVRAWNGTIGPTYANGSLSQFWSFKTIQERLVVFEGFLRPTCGICQRASIAIDQLASAFSTEPVVFIEYDVDGSSNGREDRWWNAYRYGGGEGSVFLPLAMIDSGNQISNGEVDFKNVYSDMVNVSLLRPPKVDISASWRLSTDEIETTIDITNFSAINLSYDNQATIFMIVYENNRVGLTDRYVRSVVREEITNLAPGANANFILTTNELVVDDWNNIDVIVLADYISDSIPYYNKFDTLQAVIAIKITQ